jgi:N-methylhydantoinase B
MSSLALDPITLEIIWNSFRSVTDECFLTLQRSAFSTNIKERHDHSVAVLDSRGRLIVQAENALPIHLASIGGLVEILLGKYSGDIAPAIFSSETTRMWPAEPICLISIWQLRSLTAKH